MSAKWLPTARDEFPCAYPPWRASQTHPAATLPVPVPGFVLKAALGDFAQEGVLIGQRLLPRVLESSGFAFAHRDLASALQASL